MNAIACMYTTIVERHQYSRRHCLFASSIHHIEYLILPLLSETHVGAEIWVFNVERSRPRPHLPSLKDHEPLKPHTLTGFTPTP